MKRVWILITMLFASLALVGCVEDEEIASAVEVFCTNNPDALVCQNPDATRDAVVADMFNTVLLEFVSGENTNFCTDYFDDSTLIDTCENDKWALVPDDVTSLSDDLVIQALATTNEFEVLTENPDGTPAYRFIVRVTERDGLLRFNRFDYETITSEEPQAIDEMDIKMLMNTMINDQDDAMAYCDTYFTSTGKTDCLSGVVQPAFFMYNPIVTHIDGSTYTYAVKTYDGRDQMVYTVDLVLDASNQLKIDGISVEHRPAYNTLAHAHELVTDNLVYQFNRQNGGTYNACSYVWDDGTTDCRDTLLPFEGETMTIVQYQESATPGLFTFTLGFDSGQLDVQVEVVLDEYHNYWLDVTWGTPVSDPTTELTALFEQYLDDLFDPAVSLAEMTYLMDGFYVQYFKDNTDWYEAITLQGVTILEQVGNHLYVEMEVAFDFAPSHYKDDFTRTYIDKVELTDQGYLIPPINHYPPYRDHTFEQANDLIQRTFAAFYDGSIDYDDFFMNEQQYEAVHFNDLIANPALFFPATRPTEVLMVEVPGVVGYYSLWFRYEDERGHSYWIPPFYELDISYEDGDHKILATYRTDWDNTEHNDLVASWHSDFRNPAVADEDVCAIVSGIGIDCGSLRAAALAGTSTATARTEEVLPGLMQPYLDLTIGDTTYVMQLNVALNTSSPWGYKIASLEYQNPDISYTIDMVQDRLEDMMQVHVDGNFACVDYFTGSALTSCLESAEELFPTGTPVVVLEQWDNPLSFVVYPYSYNGAFDGYTQRFPVYQVTVDASTGDLLFDTLTIFTPPTESDFIALVETFRADVWNPELSDAEFCAMYEFPAYHSFHDWMPCATFRQMLLAAGSEVDYSFRFGADPYGTTIPIVSIVVDDVAYEFEPSIRYETATGWYISRLWYILYPDATGITLDDVAYATIDFEYDLLDDTLDSTTFCLSYPALEDCVTWRDALLASNDVTIGYEGGIQADGTSDLRIIIEVDGVPTTLDFTVDASGDTPRIDTLLMANDCVCDDTSCDWTQLVHTIANEALWERIVSAYNDTTIDDATLLAQYFGDVANDLIARRASAAGALQLVDVEIHWVDGIFVDATAVLDLEQGDHIVRFVLRYVATTPEEGQYLVTFNDVMVDSSLTLVQTTLLYEQYLDDYMDYNISNETLTQTYFAGELGSLLEDRITFLFGGGTIEFDRIVLQDGVFYARYKTIEGGVETMFEQALFAHSDSTMTFGERRTLGAVLRDTSQSEALTILTKMFEDLMDPLQTMDEVCETYFGGLANCPFDVATDPSSTTYAIHSITADTSVVPTAYDVVYERHMFGVSHVIVERFTVQVADDGTVLVVSLGRSVTPDSDIAFGLNDTDLTPYITYIQQLFTDYFDPTISSTTFCSTHRYYDEYLEYVESQFGYPEDQLGSYYCRKFRDENFLQNAHLDIVNIEFIGIGRHYDGSEILLFDIVSHGYYTIYKDVNEGKTYDYRTALVVHVNDQAPFGYQAQFDYLSQGYMHPLSPAQLDDFIASELAFLSHPETTGVDVCNRYGIYTPGHRCFLDQASVDGWTLIKHEAVVAPRSVTPFSSSFGVSVDIRLLYEDPATGLRKTITIPLDAGIDYVSAIEWYDVYDDPSNYRVVYATQHTALDYDALLASANAFVQAYFDPSLSTADFITQYQNGVDRSYGELDSIRSLDLGNAISPSVVDVGLMKFMTTSNEHEHYVYLYVQNGDVIHPSHLVYLEPDGATPGYFQVEYMLIQSYLLGLVLP